MRWSDLGPWALDGLLHWCTVLLLLFFGQKVLFWRDVERKIVHPSDGPPKRNFAKHNFYSQRGKTSPNRQKSTQMECSTKFEKLEKNNRNPIVGLSSAHCFRRFEVGGPVWQQPQMPRWGIKKVKTGGILRLPSKGNGVSDRKNGGNPMGAWPVC